MIRLQGPTVLPIVRLPEKCYEDYAPSWRHSTRGNPHFPPSLKTHSGTAETVSDRAADSRRVPSDA